MISILQEGECTEGHRWKGRLFSQGWEWKVHREGTVEETVHRQQRTVKKSPLENFQQASAASRWRGRSSSPGTRDHGRNLSLGWSAGELLWTPGVLKRRAGRGAARLELSCKRRDADQQFKAANKNSSHDQSIQVTLNPDECRVSCFIDNNDNNERQQVEALGQNEETTLSHKRWVLC